jgi:putative tryptophan/tyrosine transport system substrate-binding protein
VRRREFIAGLGATTAWPLAARAQQPARVRRVGVLQSGAEDDPSDQAAIAALREGLQKLGWTEDRNLRIDIRFGDNDLNRFRAYAEELVGLAPD